MMRRPFRVVALAFALLIAAAPALARPMIISKRITGSLLTNVVGSSLTQPPYIRVIRSEAGLDYTFAEYEKLKNRITLQRVIRLKKALRNVNYDTEMIVGVFSLPIDNYKLTLDDIDIDNRDEIIEARVTFQHTIRNYPIPPKKSVHYILAVVAKSDFPVILFAKENVTKKRASVDKEVRVTGRLMSLTDGGLQLVPVVIRRGNKNSYYLSGSPVGELRKHIGKVVKLRGTVSHERDGPYEFDMTVQEIIKIFP